MSADDIKMLPICIEIVEELTIQDRINMCRAWLYDHGNENTTMRIFIKDKLTELERQLNK